MAIQVSGVNVIDNQRNLNVGVLTATSLDVDPVAITFSPSDGSSDVAVDSNIVITYNASVAKGSGNITLKDGDPSTGDTIETIAVSSGNVTLSAAQVTINPSSDLPTGKDIYVVIDEGAFVQSNTELGGSSALLNTYNFTTGPITVSSFSPSDGATDQDVTTNIVITFSENITKQTNASTSYITLRQGNPSTGTIRQTIDVSTSAVSVSGNQATINPPSDLEYEEDTYVVVDANSFFNSDGDADSGNAEINTYNFTTEQAWPALGAAGEGGYLICCSSNNYWIVAPRYSEVTRCWYQRSHAITKAQQCSGCSGWFIPSCAQLVNPGACCRTYWDYWAGTQYWSNTPHGTEKAWHVFLYNGGTACLSRTLTFRVRAFRCVSY